jgi:membrane-associated HD superfamily phosphohydrolase
MIVGAGIVAFALLQLRFNRLEVIAAAAFVAGVAAIFMSFAVNFGLSMLEAPTSYYVVAVLISGMLPAIVVVGLVLLISSMWRAIRG